LVTGNPVLAKPAEETPLIATQAVQILHEAGVPVEVLQLLPGAGDIGAALVAHPDVAGVLFTGSTHVAKLIQRELAGHDGPPAVLIAETGGQNAMIVDSSALAEQVTTDVIASAFDSAGQRCSALRILALQSDIADRQISMLKGALAELKVGNPDRLSTDIGPVITQAARDAIHAHVDRLRGEGCAIWQANLSADTSHGSFIAPTIIEIENIAQIGGEVFGPVLHVLRFDRDDLGGVVDAINATGYGLTFGLHTRLDETIAEVTGRIAVGNVYVNRNSIGAVVGCSPLAGAVCRARGQRRAGRSIWAVWSTPCPAWACPAIRNQMSWANSASIGSNRSVIAPWPLWPAKPSHNACWAMAANCRDQWENAISIRFIRAAMFWPSRKRRRVWLDNWPPR
jgi:RHH-type proline utilization regulon transcriptional repressor/proline dehydrogenase/delta 1-pyrroline-5-carboxylate dehydrogenase